MADILDTLDDLDDVYEGEILEEDDEDLLPENYEMNEDEAQEITDAIRSAATATYILLAKAHQGKAYKALGYDTWAEYVKDEFEISTQRSYQLLDLSKTITAIESAAPEGTTVKLTEAQARDIKRELPRITEEIRESTRDKTPEEAEEEINRIIEEQREQKKAEDKINEQKEKEAAQAEEDDKQAALEDQADAILEADRPEGLTDEADDGLVELDIEGDGIDRDDDGADNSVDLFNFFNILNNITQLPEPDDFVEIIPTNRADEVSDKLLKATSWFNRLQTLWELHEED